MLHGQRLRLGSVTSCSGNAISEASNKTFVCSPASTLPNLTAASEGRFNVPFFSNKAAIEEEIRKLEFARTTYVELGLFWQNLYEWTPACFEGDALIIAAPISGDAKMPFVDVRDLVHKLFILFYFFKYYHRALPCSKFS